jgi:hypothetical protein
MNGQIEIILAYCKLTGILSYYHRAGRGVGMKAGRCVWARVLAWVSEARATPESSSAAAPATCQAGRVEAGARSMVAV